MCSAPASGSSSPQDGGNPVGLLVPSLPGGVRVVLGWVTTVPPRPVRDRPRALLRRHRHRVAALKVVIGVTLSRRSSTPCRTSRSPAVPIPGVGTDPVPRRTRWLLRFLVSGLLYWMLHRTNLGLKIRSVGENPKAADSLGVSVARTRIWCSTAGAALMALAGAYLPMTYTGTYTEGIVAGRGWLAIALAFFGGGARSTSSRARPSSPAWRSWPCGCRWAASTSPTSSSRCCRTSRPCWS